jgi:hypothetical protein
VLIFSEKEGIKEKGEHERKLTRVCFFKKIIPGEKD